jgi:hypothetical protein
MGCGAIDDSDDDNDNNNNNKPHHHHHHSVFVGILGLVISPVAENKHGRTGKHISTVIRTDDPSV